jgi:hypothetical protein
MPEQLHQRLQRHPGVNQSGGVGVPQRMWSDLAEAGGLGGAGQLLTQRLRGDAAALVDQQELGGPAGARVRQRPAGGARRATIRSVTSRVSSSRGTMRSVFSLPSGTQPRALAGDLVHAVQF